MFGVGWADGQSVPSPFLVVQRASQRHSSSITMNPKHALAVHIQVKRIGEGWPWVHIISCHLGDNCANQSICMCVGRQEKRGRNLGCCWKTEIPFFFFFIKKYPALESLDLTDRKWTEELGNSLFHNRFRLFSLSHAEWAARECDMRLYDKITGLTSTVMSTYPQALGSPEAEESWGCCHWGRWWSQWGWQSLPAAGFLDLWP